VRQALPEAVERFVVDRGADLRRDTVCGIDYDMTTPVLVKAVKAQRAALVEVQNRVEAVFERLAALDRYNAALLAQLNELAARVDSLAGTGGGWDTTGGTRDNLDK
jgi:hypothetical protein